MRTSVQLIVLSIVAWVAASEMIIDISHWNGQIDWGKVKAAGVGLAIAKATEGISYQDNTFVKNWEGIKKNNIKAGAYHYLRGSESVGSQVENIKSMLQKVNFDSNNDMLAIDVEEGSNQGVSKEKMADTVNGVLQGLSGTYKNLWIYTGPYYWEDKVGWKKYDFSVYKLWIAHYTTKSQPITPSTWKSKGYSLWQYTDKGRVNGISGNVDMSRV